MEPAPLLSLPSRWLKTSHPSRWWTIHELPLRHGALGEGAAPSSVVAVNEVQHSVVEEGPFNEWAKAEVAHRLVISTTITVVDEEAEDVASGGRTTTSRNETATLQSISVLSG